MTEIPGTTHYSGRVGPGYPVQKPYIPPKQPQPERRLSAYERAMARTNQKYQQRKRAFADMLSNPNSKHHGSGYAYASGCPCNCGKCLARRNEYNARRKEQRQRRKEERKAFEEKLERDR